MRILAVGDIVADCGWQYVCHNLGRIRQKYGVDFCVANGENAANTNGITMDIAEDLYHSGVDLITMGNHTFSTYEAGKVLEELPYIIRPLNLPPEVEGVGYRVQDLGNVRIAVINLLGRVNMSPVDCPFRAVDRALKEMDAEVILVDFHAEATSERIAMAHYLDGRVSAVFGTHTHVQTADERILTGGTGYLTDLGMTGVEDSVLGVKKEIILQSYLQAGKRFRFEKAEGQVWFHGCLFDIDPATGKTLAIERLRFAQP